MKNNEIKKSYSPLKSWLQEWIASASELSTSQEHQNQEQNLGFKNGFLVNFKNSRTKK